VTDMEIPVEAWIAAGEAILCNRDPGQQTNDMIEAVAPHIARAAQVAILRELRRRVDELPSHRMVNGSFSPIWFRADDVVHLVAELEAGAGQAGERDGR